MIFNNKLFYEEERFIYYDNIFLFFRKCYVIFYYCLILWRFFFFKIVGVLVLVINFVFSYF